MADDTMLLRTTPCTIREKGATCLRRLTSENVASSRKGPSVMFSKRWDGMGDDPKLII